MKKLAFNPYLPSYEYIPDGEPHVFGNRLYLFGSHDRFGGKDYCLNDYVCWSAPVDDLADWRYEGVIYRKDQHPRGDGSVPFYAPDVACGLDGNYYLYYSVKDSSIISVAICDTPAGKYEYYGDVKSPEGHVYGTDLSDWYEFDPAVLVDDGRVWLYSGTGQASTERQGHPVVGAFVRELEADMLTSKSDPSIIMPRVKRSLTKPAFFEGSSVRKIGDIYYFVYPATDLTGLNYCTSKYPDRDFVYRGIIHSTSDMRLNGHSLFNPAYPLGNNHGGIVYVKEQYYIFDHRMTNRTFYARQGVAEPITINEDGSINQVESTSCGLNGGILPWEGKYPAYIACNLMPGKILGLRNPLNGPYMTQEGEDREDNPNQYVKSITSGSLVGFKYFQFDGLNKKLSVTLRGRAKGILRVLTGEKGQVVAEVKVDIESAFWKDYHVSMKALQGKHAIFFTFKGKGTLDMESFEMS